MTTALEGGEESAARPGRTLPPGKTQYPFYSRLGGPHGRSGRAENLAHTGIRSRTVQPIVSHYTDWATGPTCSKYWGVLNDGKSQYIVVVSRLHGRPAENQAVMYGVSLHWNTPVCVCEHTSFVWTCTDIGALWRGLIPEPSSYKRKGVVMEEGGKMLMICS